MRQIVITRLTGTDYRIVTFGERSVESEELIVRELLAMRIDDLARRLDAHDAMRHKRATEANTVAAS